MSISIGPIEIEQKLDVDGELEISMRDETYYLTISQVETMRDHLTNLLNDRCGKL